MIKIAFIGQPEYFQFVYENELDKFAEVFKFQLHIGLNLSDFDTLIDFQADYNFFFRGEYLPDGILEQLKGVRVALSSEPFPRVINEQCDYTIDSIQRYLFFRSIRKMPFDYVFHYDAASIPFFKWDRLFLSGQFAFPVAMSVYLPRGLPKIWDLFFIGRSTSHRESYFGLLKHKYNFLHICHGVWGGSLVDYISSAKICLNIHAENEISWEPRMQIMLACGAFVISEKITPNTYLRPGIDYVEISSPKELYKVVEYYLKNDVERSRIAQNGRERVQAVLDSKVCFQQLIQDIGNRKYKNFTFEKGRLLINCLAKINRIWIWVKRYIW